MSTYIVFRASIGRDEACGVFTFNSWLLGLSLIYLETKFVTSFQKVLLTKYVIFVNLLLPITINWLIESIHFN